MKVFQAKVETRVGHPPVPITWKDWVIADSEAQANHYFETMLQNGKSLKNSKIVGIEEATAPSADGKMFNVVPGAEADPTDEIIELVDELVKRLKEFNPEKKYEFVVDGKCEISSI